MSTNVFPGSPQEEENFKGEFRVTWFCERCNSRNFDNVTGECQICFSPRAVTLLFGNI